MPHKPLDSPCPAVLHGALPSIAPSVFPTVLIPENSMMLSTGRRQCERVLYRTAEFKVN